MLEGQIFVGLCSLVSIIPCHFWLCALWFPGFCSFSKIQDFGHVKFPTHKRPLTVQIRGWHMTRKIARTLCDPLACKLAHLHENWGKEKGEGGEFAHSHKWAILQARGSQGPRGVLPSKRLLGMCRWMGSHFHNWIDYNGVTFLVELLKWGRTFSGCLG